MPDIVGNLPANLRRKNGGQDLSGAPRHGRHHWRPHWFQLGRILAGLIWALSRRMWFAAFAMVAVELALYLPGLWLDRGDIVTLLLSILFGIACGKYGNGWHRRVLEKRGYAVL